MKRTPLYVFLVSVAVLIAVVAASLSFGGVHVPLENVWHILWARATFGEIAAAVPVGHQAIIWELRLPRSLLAIMVGAGLTIVGISLQALTRNPLADPHLLGISSGGAFGAILAILHVGLIFGQVTVPIFAFLGSLVATGMVLGFSSLTQTHSATKLVLVGVAISFVVMAAANFLIILGDPKATHMVVYWMLGGLGTAQWSILPNCLVVLGASSLYFWISGAKLNAVSMGDETASTLGIIVHRFRLQAFAVGALLTGVLVSYSGVIGFVGLMIPHIARLLVGGNNTVLVPISGVLGALFMLTSDLLARTILAPQVIPVGVITGLIGGLFFLWLLTRQQIR